MADNRRKVQLRWNFSRGSYPVGMDKYGNLELTRPGKGQVLLCIQYLHSQDSYIIFITHQMCIGCVMKQMKRMYISSVGKTQNVTWSGKLNAPRTKFGHRYMCPN